MKTLRFADRLVPLSDCTLGRVVGILDVEFGVEVIAYGHIKGFSASSIDDLSLKVLSSEDVIREFKPSQLVADL